MALAAATVLPMQSEAVLAGLLIADYSPCLLIAVASIGNVLGSVVNWLLGRGIEGFRHRRWLPASNAGLERAQRWYHRYGKWTLLLSWVPIVGDPLTVAGVMRELFYRLLRARWSTANTALIERAAALVPSPVHDCRYSPLTRNLAWQEVQVCSIVWKACSADIFIGSGAASFLLASGPPIITSPPFIRISGARTAGLRSAAIESGDA